MNTKMHLSSDYLMFRPKFGKDIRFEEKIRKKTKLLLVDISNAWAEKALKISLWLFGLKVFSIWNNNSMITLKLDLHTPILSADTKS